MDNEIKTLYIYNGEDGDIGKNIIN